MTRAQRSPTERQAWRQGLSVAIATAAYGISFGALSVASGLDVWQTCALSLLMFSGGSQFALVGVVAGGGAPATAIASAAILGVRNTLYGLSVRPWLGAHGATRVPAAILTIDESTAVGLAQPDVRARRVGFWVTGIGIYLGWNATTLAGALVGDVLGDVRMWGLDAAAAAAFVGLLWPRLATRQAAAVGVASAVVAAALVPALPAGVPVLVAVVVAIVVGWTNWLGRPATAATDAAAGTDAPAGTDGEARA